jgi:hypothetical protein
MTTTAPDQAVTFEQMKGAVGTLLYLWSGIERELAVAIRKQPGNERPCGISRSLDVWSQQVALSGEHRPLQTQLCDRALNRLRDALVVRNLVCHGLIGIAAQGYHGSDDAYITVELGADRRILTWQELQAMFKWLSHMKFLISVLTSAAMQENAVRGNEMLLGWEEFLRDE